MKPRLHPVHERPNAAEKVLDVLTAAGIGVGLAAALVAWWSA